LQHVLQVCHRLASLLIVFRDAACGASGLHKAAMRGQFRP
jgi:hypothetical protein